MEAFLRQLAALGVMVALCHLLLPEGKLKDAASLTMSLLVCLLLLSSASGLLGSLRALTAPSDAEILSRVTWPAGAHERAAIQTMANQLADQAVKALADAGVNAEVTAYYTDTGALDSVAVACEESGDVTRVLTQQCGLAPEKIRFAPAGGV